jgi:hypothetical protein
MVAQGLTGGDFMMGVASILAGVLAGVAAGGIAGKVKFVKATKSWPQTEDRMIYDLFKMNAIDREVGFAKKPMMNRASLYKNASVGDMEIMGAGASKNAGGEAVKKQVSTSSSSVSSEVGDFAQKPLYDYQMLNPKTIRITNRSNNRMTTR